MDEHAAIRQDDVVHYFANHKEGTLVFTQSALSKNLARRPQLLARASSNLVALSGKHLRVVTHPGVERRLVLWVNHMLARGEVVNSHMLRTVRKKFEEEMQVQENQRLPAGR